MGVLLFTLRCDALIQQEVRYGIPELQRTSLEPPCVTMCLGLVAYGYGNSEGDKACSFSLMQQ